MLRKMRLCATFIAFSLTIFVFVYWKWLNAPPTAVIPQSAVPTTNGHDILSAAGSLLKDDSIVSDALPDRPDDKGHVYTLGERDALIAENATALVGMSRSLSLPYWNPPVRSTDAAHPEFSRFRAMVRLLLLESKVRAARRDASGAADSCLDAIQIGVNVPHGGGIEAQLVGNVCEQLGDRFLWLVIETLDAASAVRATHRLETMDIQRFPYTDTLLEEKWSGQAALINVLEKQSTFDRYREYVRGRAALANFIAPIAQAAGEDSVTAEVSPEVRFAAYRFMLTHSKRRIFADFSAAMDANIAQSHLPYSVHLPEIKESRDEVEPFTVPVLSSARFKDVEIRMRTGLILCALALRAYHARRGAYPAALADLVSDGLLKHLPDDPFAGADGRPFHYRRLEAGTFLLYSVGSDGVDDGGRPVPIKTNNQRGNNFMESTDKGDWVVGTDIGATNI